MQSIRKNPAYKIIIWALRLLLVGVIVFVAYNFIRDLNVEKVDQSETPSVEEVREALANSTATPEASTTPDSSATPEPATQEPDQTATPVAETPAPVATSTPAPVVTATETPAPVATSTPAPAATAVTTPVPTPVPNSFIPRSGSFTGDNGYSVSGQAEIIDFQGQKLLKLGDNFTSSGGPDLVVYLSPNSVQSGQPLGGFVSLGGLQSSSGAQLYNLPANYEDFDSVVIWCRAFSQQFGSADLN